MSLKVYNSLARTKEDFIPLQRGYVGIYVCGPTVYSHPHVGHGKSYVSFDAMVRYLRYLKYKVRYVQNITDVGHLTDNADAGEDKIAKRAALERLEPMELVEKYTRSYFEDMDQLGVVRPDISPRASGHLIEQMEIIKQLLAKGHAYEVNDSVYFAVRTWPEYGKLSGRDLEELREGTRIEVLPDKRDPVDFALWKRAEPSHILRWPSPWGVGFPGWHIECSAMSMRYLGQTFDIHGGGLDNQFPHHECEIAQSEAATGQTFVRYWLHNNLVTIDGAKMGKSLGNAITLKEVLGRFEAPVVRSFILSSHYRSTLDFSDSALEGAARGLERLWGTVQAVQERLHSGAVANGEADEEFVARLQAHKARFLEQMDDDFNTAGAIGVLFDLTRDVNELLQGEATDQDLHSADKLYRELAGEVLGLLPERGGPAQGEALTPKLIQLLIDLRNEYRAARDFKRSDTVRDKLASIGVVLEDTANGTRWKLARQA
ncbi:MAG: cysteine--tRNA ligase [Deinococcus sp.]|nr:cysteine--tRNA ligase [Deinococcus sp.]